MDANTQLAIASIAGAASAVGVAWIAFKQASLSKAVEEVRHNTNSLTSQLVAKTEITSHAEGKAEGVAEERATEAVDNTAPPR